MEILDTILKVEQLLFPLIGGIFVLGVWCNNLRNEIKNNKEDIEELKQKFDPALSTVINEKFEAMDKGYDRLHKDHESLERVVGGISKDLNQLIGLVKGLHPKGEHDDD